MRLMTLESLKMNLKIQLYNIDNDIEYNTEFMYKLTYPFDKCVFIVIHHLC